MIFLIIILFIILISFSLFKAIFEQRIGEVEKPKYEYRKKQFFMTRPEHEAYDALERSFGGQYYIFSQVHLPTIVDHKVKGQNWRAAFTHINGKSVDFVLCDKTYISPQFVIELDDSTHEREDRIERDEEVERILRYAGLALLRIKNTEIDQIVEKVNDLLKSK